MLFKSIFPCKGTVLLNILIVILVIFAMGQTFKALPIRSWANPQKVWQPLRVKTV